MSPFMRGAIAIVVALLVGLGVTALALRGDGAPVARDTPTPSPEATATAPPLTPGPEPEDPLTVFADIEEQVISLRGLPSAEIGPPELLTREELAAELQAIFEEEYPEEDREADNVTLRAMGLLEEDEDIGELQLRLLEQQVLGFYDETEQRMVVVTDRGIDAEAKMTYAHEYTHALQDAAFGLASLGLDATGEDDRVLAVSALVEGDASVSMFLWAFEHLTPAEMQDLQAIPQPDTTGIPEWLVQILIWPYIEGPEFIFAIAGEDLLSGDWSAVDAAYENPPLSTSQIIWPEKYLDGVVPIEIEPVDLAGEVAAVVGGAWHEVDSTAIGEAFTAIWLEALGADTDTAWSAAAGWAGDRLTAAAADDGEDWVLNWQITWDRAADADEFAAAYESVTGELPFAAELVRLGETEIVVRHASTEEMLGALPALD